MRKRGGPFKGEVESLDMSLNILREGDRTNRIAGGEAVRDYNQGPRTTDSTIVIVETGGGEFSAER